MRQRLADRPGGRAGPRMVYGVTDQAVSAANNVLTTLIAARLVSAGQLGTLTVAVTAGYFAIGLGRAFVGEALLAVVSTLEGSARREKVRDAATAALTFGVAAALVALLAWGLGFSQTRYLIWIVPLLPLVLLHDTGRYVALSQRKPVRALVIDLTWSVVQGGLTLALWLTGTDTPGTLLAAWSLGGAAGALMFCFRDRVNPLCGRLRAWWRETSHLSRWYTPSQVLAQSQVMAITVLVGGLVSHAAQGGLRVMQAVVLQPSQNLFIAISSLLVPRISVDVAQGDRRAVHRLVLRAATVLAVAGLLVAVAVMLLRHPLTHLLFPKQAAFADLLIPLSLQAALYGTQMPFTAALRGMQRAAQMFIFQVLFSGTSIIGVVLGAVLGGVEGVGWGLLAGAAVGFVITYCRLGSLHL